MKFETTLEFTNGIQIKTQIRLYDKIQDGGGAILMAAAAAAAILGKEEVL